MVFEAVRRSGEMKIEAFVFLLPSSVKRITTESAPL